MPKFEMREKCGEITAAQKCKCKHGCAVSSIRKVDLFLGFNDSIKYIVVLITNNCL